MSWRVGSKVPLNVYDDSRPRNAANFFGLVCTCHAVEDAAAIVAEHNRQEDVRKWVADEWARKVL